MTKPKSKKKNPTFLGFEEPDWLQRIHLPNWMVIVLFLVFIFRIPTLFEPYYNSYESLYLTVGHSIRVGGNLFSDIPVDQAPVMFLLASVVGSLFWLKALAVAWMMATTAAFYKLSKELFGKKTEIIKAAVITFAVLTTLPLLEANIVTAPLFAIGPVITAFWLILRSKKQIYDNYLAGVLLSIALLISPFAIAEILFIFTYSLAFTKTKSLSIKEKRNVFEILIGLLVSFFVVTIYFYVNGVFSNFVNLYKFDLNNLIFLRLIILLFASSVLYYFRKKLAKEYIFATLLLLFSLSAATIASTNQTFVLMQIIPAASLLIGMLIAMPTIEQSLTVIPLIILVLVIKYFGYWYYPTFSYYKNFVDFSVSAKDITEYRQGVNYKVNDYYELAGFIKSTSEPDDKVFIWGDAPAVYALSERLPHINLYNESNIVKNMTGNELLTSIADNNVEFVVLMKDATAFPALEALVRDRYILVKELQGSKVYSYVQGLQQARFR